MTKLRILLSCMLLPLAWGSMSADDFNPSNPPEPNDNYVYKHLVTVEAIPAGMGYTSGSGKYAEGTSVTVSTSSAVANWVFKRWLVDGEPDTSHTSSSFSHVVGLKDVTYTAVYEYEEPEDPEDPEEPELPPFDPANPDEPQTPVFPDKPDPPTPPVVIPKYQLTILSTPFEACSFNINSGNSYEAGTVISLRYNLNQGFEFLGWYAGDELIGTMNPLSYVIPEENATIEARFVFNPSMPDEPEVNVKYCDINYDLHVDVSDLQILLNILFGSSAHMQYNGDINSDSTTDVRDLQLLLNEMMRQ